MPDSDTQTTAYKAPTIRDVAQEAGVSPYTVSVVLNGSRSNTRVSEATRERILAVAATLDYHPNAIARSLAGQRTRVLGVLFGIVGPHELVTNPYASAILQGILSGAAQADYSILIFTEPWKDRDHPVRTLRDRRTDGVVVVAPLTDSPVMSGLTALPLPLVAVSYPGESLGVTSVDVDNVAGARLATNYLLALGHRRIAHLIGSPNLVSSALRRDTFLQTMKEAGFSVPDAYLVPGSYDAATAVEATQRLLSLPEPPTALFAGNDAMAIAALNAARSCGVSVPERLSIVGFDDIPAAALVTPTLTTVQQPLHTIGESAVRLLIQRLEGEQSAQEAHLLPPELIVRDSTARVP